MNIMGKSLYEEAVADARQLRELAEETAKNRVVEAVMPQIRDLVNRRILGEQLEDLEVDDDSELEGVVLDDELISPMTTDTTNGSTGAIVNVTAQGDVNIDVEPDESEGDDLVLTDTMAEALGRLIRGEVTVEPTLAERLTSLEARARRLSAINESVNGR